MIKVFTTTASMAIAIAMSAITPSGSVSADVKVTTEKTGPVTAVSEKIIRHHSAARPQGLRLPGNSISVNRKSTARLASLRRADFDGVFYETFEYDDEPLMWREEMADLTWLPDGWSRISATEGAKPLDQWYAYPLTLYTMIPCDGNYAMALLYNSEPKDEWLVSPEVAITEGQYLTFGWWCLPVYLWTMDSKHVDFTNQVYIDREIAATLKVMISVDGGEWKELKDMSDDFAGKEFGELFDMYPEEMFSAKISLADYAGQTVKIAFRYVGTDGNSIFVDGVGINNGIAQVDALYMPPMTSLYVGGTVEGQILDGGAQVHPFDTPLTWYNWSDNTDDASYAWTCLGLQVEDESTDEITVTFRRPEVSGNEPFEWYMPPTLSAQAEGSRSNTYTENVLLMAAGKPQVEDVNYGLLPFDVINDGTSIHTVEPSDFGKRGIPIFGYNEETDAFWRLYTCGGDEENLPHIPYAYVSGILNAVMPSERPMVVNGAWLYAIGLIGDEAHLTCTVYSHNDEGEFDKVLATKTISGKDAVQIDTRMNLLYYVIPFTFDEPVVMDSNSAGLYSLVITGFHDGGIEYFAPVMQTIPNRYELGFGFYQIEYMFNDEHQVGLSSVAYHENEHGEMYCAFTINLDAEYPWLECYETEINLPESGEARVKLNSFYRASELSVTMADGEPLPQWLTVSGVGRYGNAYLTFNATDPSQAIDSEIVIKAPGVAKTVNIKKASGVESIVTASPTEVADTYDLMGRKVSADGQSHGVYILRSHDGRASKVVR